MTVPNTECGRIITETERLIIREMVPSDLDALCRILCDEEVMCTAYESAFSVEEAKGWMNRHFRRYEEYGFGLWAVVLKETNEMIGQCGLTMQSWRERELLEIGYLLQKAHWHKGYATEAAVACKEYAFSVLNASRVYSIIRDKHISSQNVAVRNGMKVVDKCTKNFRNVDMKFFLYCAEKMNEQVKEYIDKYSVEIIDMFNNLREMIFDNTSCEIEEKLWAKLPSYCVGESFVRLIPFKDHINIEAQAVLSHKEQLAGYKITPKGMLQIYLKQDIPYEILKQIFAETLER